MSELISRRKDIKWGHSAKEGKGNPNFTGGKYIDDKGYIRMLKPDHPKSIHGYVYEHRMVMEDFLCRQLNSWETIHHINEIKIDNRLSNLYLCSYREHSAIHREGKTISLTQKAALRKKIRARRKVDGLRKRDHRGKYIKDRDR